MHLPCIPADIKETTDADYKSLEFHLLFEPLNCPIQPNTAVLAAIMVFLGATFLTTFASLMLMTTGGLTAWRVDVHQRIDPSMTQVLSKIPDNDLIIDLFQSIQRQTNDIQMLTKDAANRLNQLKKVNKLLISLLYFENCA